MSNKTEFILTARDDTQRAFQSALGGLDKLKASAGAILGGGLGGTAGGLATAILGAGFTAAIKDAIDDLDRMDEAAERIGLTTEALSGLAYAGKMSGVEFDEMTGALSKLSVKMQEAVSGNKDAAVLFKDIGVSVKDAAGNLKSSDQLLAEVADRFVQFENGAAKTALAVDLFGKSGAKLVPLLNQGAQGIADLNREARTLGGIIDDDLARQAAAFNDQLQRLATLSSSAGKVVAADLLPSLNGIAERFLLGVKNLGGIGGGISALIDGPGNPREQIKALQEELNDLLDARDRYLRSNADTSAIDTSIITIQKKIAAYKELEQARFKAEFVGPPVSAGGGKTPPKRTPSDGGDPFFRDDYLASVLKPAEDEARAIDKANEQLARQAQSWLDLIDPANRYNREIAEIDKLMQAAQLTPDQADVAKFFAYEQSFKSMAKDIKVEASGIDLAITNAFAGLGNAVADFALDGKASFGDMVNAMVRDMIRLETQTLATKVFKEAGGFEGILSSIGSLFKANADGGVYDSPSLSRYSNGVYDSPRLFAFAHGAGVFAEAGPEAIMPLSRGRDGKLGVKAEGAAASPTINLNIYGAPSQPKVETRRNGSAFDVDVVFDQIDGRLANNLARGRGATAGVMGQMFGLRPIPGV